MSDSNLNPNGESKPEMIENPRDLQSTSGESTKKPGNPNTSDMSGTTPTPMTSPGTSQLTPNLGEIPNAIRMIGALSSSKAMKPLVEWRRLELADGSEVFALCFPLDRFEVSAGGDLVLKAR